MKMVTSTLTTMPPTDGMAIGCITSEPRPFSEFDVVIRYDRLPRAHPVAQPYEHPFNPAARQRAQMGYTRVVRTYRAGGPERLVYRTTRHHLCLKPHVLLRRRIEGEKARFLICMLLRFDCLASIGLTTPRQPSSR